MSAGPVATLRVMLSADDAQMRTALGRSDKASRKWAAAQKRRNEAVAKTARNVGTAILAATAAYAGATVKAIRDVDQLAKSAKSLGVTVDALSSLSYAASRSGVSSDQLAVSLRTLNKSIGESSLGLGESRLAFKQLGVDIRNTDGTIKDSRTILSELSDALSKVESPAQRAALAQKILGESGAAMLPLLNEGSKGIKALEEQAKALGLTMSDTTAAKAEVLNDKLTTMSDVLTNKMNTALIESADKAMPAIVRGLDIMQGVLTGVSAAIDVTIARFHLFKGAIYGAVAGGLKAFREFTNFIEYGVNTVGTRMVLLGEKIRLGLVESLTGAAKTADDIMSKAPAWLQNFLGYEKGSISGANQGFIDQIRANINALESELSSAMQEYQNGNKPSLAETVLTELSETAIADATARVSSAADKIRQAAGLVTGDTAGLASTVNSTVDGSGGSTANGLEGDVPAQVTANEKIAESVSALDTVQKMQADNEMKRKALLSGAIGKFGATSKTASRLAALATTAMSMAGIMSTTELAKMRAMAELGPIAGPPMAAAIQAQGATSLGIAAASGVMGMFHDGIDNVPNTGTYLLEKGERVVDKRLNEDLTKSLQGGGGLGGGNNFAFTFEGDLDPERVDTLIRQSKDSIQQVLSEINSDRAGAGLI